MLSEHLSQVFVEANEPSLYFRCLKLSLQFCSCIMSNPSNPVYDINFESCCTAPFDFECDQNAIEPFGLHIYHIYIIRLDKSNNSKLLYY